MHFCIKRDCILRFPRISRSRFSAINYVSETFIQVISRPEIGCLQRLLCELMWFVKSNLFPLLSIPGGDRVNAVSSLGERSVAETTQFRSDQAKWISPVTVKRRSDLTAEKSRRICSHTHVKEWREWNKKKLWTYVYKTAVVLHWFKPKDGSGQGNT